MSVQLVMAIRQLGYGNGVAQMSTDEIYLIRGSELTERLLKHFEAPAYQPPTLPRVGMELMELVRKPEVSMAHVVSLCEQDSMVAARVIQVAESAAYRTAAPVRSLHDAAMRLGMRKLADVFLEVTFKMRVFRAPGFSAWMHDVGVHSIATARAARIVCRHTGFPDGYAFVAGLLHDIGVAASLITLSSLYDKEHEPDLALLRLAVDEAHETAAARLAALWELPADLEMVLGNHHSMVIGGRVHPLAAAVALADSLAGELGMDGGFPCNDAQVGRAVTHLGLSERQLAQIRTEVAGALGDLATSQ